MMLKAAFLTQHANWPWRRQLPNGQAVVDGVEFFAPVDEADIVFVYDALPEGKVVVGQSALAVFVASEPENVKRYNAAFLAQFDAVITSDRETPHPHRIFVQAGLPWHAGSMSVGGRLLDNPMQFGDFEKHDPEKTKLVSVVSSDKSFTAEHRARLAFVAKLKAALGDRVDVFGRGIIDFADKRDVLDAYRYHIALENCAIEDYWTEKIADPYLTLTFPIYHGCPNIASYFSESAFRTINIYNPDEAVCVVKEIINSDLAERSRDALWEARRRVMHEHNVFCVLGRVTKDLVATRGGDLRSGPIERSARVLLPETHFVSFVEGSRFWLHYQLGKRPMLRNAFQFLKLQGFLAEKRFIHYWKYLTDEFYRSHQRWISDNPQEEVRFQYDLPSGANVLDVGGYAGDFAAKFADCCDAHVAVFEPVPRFASQIEQRFADNKRIRVYGAGLSDQDGVVDFDIDADASGAFTASGGEKIRVILWDVETFLGRDDVSEWHLAKLNIEGGEYAVLNRLIDTGRIETIRYLQVQFHLHVPGARGKYRQLAKRLRRTHKLQWRYPFVWESWERLGSVRSSHGQR